MNRQDAIYARQSVEKKDSLSISGQVDLCRRMAGEKDPAVYRDAGYSGKNTERPAFRQLMQENVYVRCYAYQMTAERFSDTMWTMQQILFMSADRRLAIFLTDELAKTGGADLRMTHDQIARYMGSAREVVSRLLKYFAGEGLVRLYRGGVTVLDKERLKQIANGT